MNYSQQLFYKNQEVFNNLKRIGKIELPEFEPILGSEKQFFYRTNDFSEQTILLNDRSVRKRTK